MMATTPGSARSDLSDADQIRNLMARFARLVDSREFEAWTETFTPDGRFGPRTGRAGILEDILEGELATKPDLVRFHTNLNIEIDVQGDDATSTSLLVMHDRVSPGVWRTVIGRYEDTLVRTPEGWLFASRDMAVVDVGVANAQGIAPR